MEDFIIRLASWFPWPPPWPPPASVIALPVPEEEPEEYWAAA